MNIQMTLAFKQQHLIFFWTVRKATWQCGKNPVAWLHHP